MSDDSRDSSLSTSSVETEPAGADGTVDDPKAKPADAADPAKGGGDGDKPGIDEFVDNTKALFVRGEEVLPFTWAAIVILLMLPTMLRIIQGYDLTNVYNLEFSLTLFAAEVVCHVFAVVVLAMSMPVGRAYLLDDNDDWPGGNDPLGIMFDKFPHALTMGGLYYGIVLVGLMMCILPGVLAAGLLLPALYLNVVRDESMLRACLKAPDMLSEHSRLFAPVFVGFLVLFVAGSITLGMMFQWAGGLDELLGVGVLAILAFSLGFIIITAVAYVLYIALLAAFVTIDAYETGAAIGGGESAGTTGADATEEPGEPMW